MRFLVPFERIIRPDIFAMVFTKDPLKHGYRIVDLACGHKHWTNALRRARCPRCQQMFDSGDDYDGFRRLGLPDTMEWPDDPLRLFHEAEAARDALQDSAPQAEQQQR